MKRKPRASNVAAAAAGRKPGSGVGKGGGGAGGKRGLRHFAVRVCEVVRARGALAATYAEVADELVAELGTDDKNVRRRVYDSLNVLLAVGIVERCGKAVRWRGRELGLVATKTLRAQVESTRATLARKHRFLARTRAQCDHLAALVARNRTTSTNTSAGGGASESANARLRLRPPFLVLSTAQDATISAAVDADARDVTFSLDRDFTLLDDREVLRRVAGSGMMTGDSRLISPTLPALKSPPPRATAAALAPPATLSVSQHLMAPCSAPATPSPARFSRHLLLPTSPPGSLLSTPRGSLFGLARTPSSPRSAASES